MKKLLLISLLFFAFQALFAQEEVAQKKFQIGPMLGVDYGYLKVEKSDWNEVGIEDELLDLRVKNRIGFSLGLSYIFNINELIAIRAQSILAIQNSFIAYDLPNIADSYTQTIGPRGLEIPIHAVFTHRKGKKVSPSVLVGGKYLLDFSKGEAKDLNLKNNDFAIDLGTGLEIDFGKFIMKPELSYSYGLVNLEKGNDNTLAGLAIDDIHRDKISLRVLFYY